VQAGSLAWGAGHGQPAPEVRCTRCSIPRRPSPPAWSGLCLVKPNSVVVHLQAGLPGGDIPDGAPHAGLGRA